MRLAKQHLGCLYTFLLSGSLGALILVYLIGRPGPVNYVYTIFVTTRCASMDTEQQMDQCLPFQSKQEIDLIESKTASTTYPLIELGCWERDAPERNAPCSRRMAERSGGYNWVDDPTVQPRTLQDGMHLVRYVLPGDNSFDVLFDGEAEVIAAFPEYE